jgi:ribonucleotide reductase alpha subunit/intein/homing endonuclease
VAKTRDALSVEHGPTRRGLQVRRLFTTRGTHPYDQLTWERRDAVITNWRDGTTAFEQRDLDFPSAWSQNATNIVAQKYFRGPLGTPQREHSVRQMIDRVAGTITRWGSKDGYFAGDGDAEAFQAELTHLLVNQKAAFNSPVWFNVGVEPEPQCSACQPYGALVSTPTGMVPIGELVERQAVGTVVYDAHGETRVRAVKANGDKRVYRVLLRNGSFVEATADHVVYAVPERRTVGSWLRVDQLRPGMRLHLYPHRASTEDVVGRLATSIERQSEEGGGTTTLVRTEPATKEASEAALAGWLQADGFVGQYQAGTNTSLTIEFQTATEEEYDWVQHHLQVVFPGVHQHVRTFKTQDATIVGRRIRLYGEVLRPFVESWDLLARRHEMRVPTRLWNAPSEAVAAYLRSVFQADGYVTVRGGSALVAVAVIGERWTEDLQVLLLRLGIYSRRLRKMEARPDRSDLFEVRIGMRSERASFRSKVGFLSAKKVATLDASLGLDGKVCPSLREEEIVAIEDRGVQPVFDIQTDSGEYLSNNIRVHNCFILSVEDTMPSILNWYVEEGMIFKGGSGSGINLSTIRSSKEQLANGGEASGPVSFMRGADASAGTIKSGGKTRRAAKMVILNVDHPDVRDFIWCKAREEHKARVLRDAGFDMDLDGRDSISIQYQNANNSVRVTDEFMHAYEADEAFDLKAVLDGRTMETLRARDLMREIAQAAWECADPGMQYDTTINDWHTTPESGRINASNPCCFVGETLVDTDEGLVRFELLAKRSEAGETVPAVRSLDLPSGRIVSRPISAAWAVGETRMLVEVQTTAGLMLRCTPEHRFLTADAGWVEARYLSPEAGLVDSDAAGRRGVDRVAAVTTVELDLPVTVYDLEVEGTHNFVVGDGSLPTGVVVHNSEYMHLDNSACNLASMNLLKFLGDDGEFDVAAFKHAVEIVFLAQEIIVGNSSYPTEKITRNARDYRQLGLGYANLGALLMALGKAYDSDGGRAWAGSITALMTGHAYRTSARIAQVTGPFAGYPKNREPMLRVMGKHRGAVDQIESSLVQPDLLDAARTAWDEAIEFGDEFGYRNSQAVVIAPTGTIGLLMDCDTTGIEPDLALVKTKKLVGGGSMSIVNQTVPRALRTLGYAEEHVQAITEYVAENNTVKAAPALREEHYEVFDCAMGDSPIHYMGHIRMMAAAQPFISGAISKCVTGETLVATTDGLLRIGSLHEGETADTFRDEILAVASIDGLQKTDAFYYGGVRPVRRATLRSGHTVNGTPNHRLLVATKQGPQWRSLAELEVGDYVAQQYGSDLWSTLPARFDHFVASTRYGNQKLVRIPTEMTGELAFLLGAFAAEGHLTRRTHTVVITNSVESVLERVAAAWRSEFGVATRITREPGKCPGVVVSSKTIVEFLDHLGCGGRASEKRVPDAVLRSPRPMVLAFLQGLALDAYVTTGEMVKWAICLDAPKLLDDLQAILTNLGIVHGRISKFNPKYGKSYDEVYAAGEQAQRLVELVPFCEPDKAARAAKVATRTFAQSPADVIPGINGPELYNAIPKGKSGRNSWSLRRGLTFLLDPRTKHVSRRTLERVAAIPGVELPEWLGAVLRDNLHFSPVSSVEDAGQREVFDLSVPIHHAFVGNGIVNHNTVNMPEHVTVEDVEQAYLEGWKLGLKALAIYRDNCKVGQPLSADRKVTTDTGAVIEVDRAPVRRRLPKQRPSRTTSFRVGDIEGYLTAGSYPDDGLGEIFVKVSKQGSTLSGVMDAFAIAVSVGLQYGVPLEALVAKFVNMIFEPNGMTDDKDVRIAQSLVDYVARRLAIDYLDVETRHALGVKTTAERTAEVNGYGAEAPAADAGGTDAATADEAAEATTRPAAEDTQAATVPTALAAASGPTFTPGMAAVDAPYCSTCGVRMRPAGSCFVCESCGTTSGCS